MKIASDVKTQEKHLHANFTSDIETPAITFTVENYLWGSNETMTLVLVEINCEVKNKQWRLHVKVTCEVETKQWLEVMKCIVHVMTCLHLYLILVIIFAGGNKSDYWRQGRIWVWEKCCITCENHLLAQNEKSRQTNFYLSDMKTRRKNVKHIFPSNIFSMMQKNVCSLYAFLLGCFLNTWLGNKFTLVRQGKFS